MDTSSLELPVQRLGSARVGRRGLLAGGLSLSAMGVLAGCATGGSDPETTQSNGGPKSDQNPFGVDTKGIVDVVIFKGGYGDAYAKNAGELYKKAFPDSDPKVSSTVKINSELQSRFVGGNPPDVIDNSGADGINFSSIQNQLADLTDLLDAPAIGFEGKKVKDTLIKDSTLAGVFDGKLLQLNYFYTVFATWYSAKLFKDNGWTVPNNWDEVMAIGEKARGKGLHLFGFGGQNAGDYYNTMALSMAIRTGGIEVAKNLDNIKEGAFGQESVKGAYTALKQAVDAGYFLPGSAGLIHTQAQTSWVQGKFVFYPSGSWLENEMADITPKDFEMTAMQDPSVTASPKLPKGFRGTAGEPFIVPSKGKNVAGGKEYLRQLLSKEAATKTSQLVKSATIVADTVPADGFGSTALASATKIQKDGADEVYNWRFMDVYGLGKENKTRWSTFLSGKMSVDQLISESEAMTKKVRDDPSIQKYTVS